MNKRQRDNLEKLATYLEALPADYERFNMAYFKATEGDVGGYGREEYDPSEPIPEEHACSTVACAVGHGPNAGIRVYKDTSWFTYCERVFGVSEHSDEWDWLFHYNWANIDNTAFGAAQRIRHFLKYGIPDDAWQQRRGEVLLCYSA